VGKISDLLLHDTQYRNKKATHQQVTALGKGGCSTGRNAAVFTGKVNLQLNTGK